MLFNNIYSQIVNANDRNARERSKNNFFRTSPRNERVQQNMALNKAPGLNIVNVLDKTLNIVQKSTPVVQTLKQYAPLVRNLPVLIQMFKLMNKADSNKKVNPERKSEKNIAGEITKDLSNRQLYEDELREQKKSKMVTKSSVPKFFSIPADKI